MKKLVFYLLMIFSATISANPAEEMYRAFLEIPDSTRTKVWWFHGENTSTEEGMRADLEAFKEAGVGGVVYYDQQHGPGTPDAAPSMSEEWWHMLKFAAREARRLGLSFEVNISNGYVCGGPWITPELGMQALYSCDTIVHGGVRYHDAIPAPVRAGAHDIALLAFPVKPGFYEMVKCLPGGVRASDSTTVCLASFDKPFTARSLSESQRRLRPYTPLYDPSHPLVPSGIAGDVLLRSYPCQD